MSKKPKRWAVLILAGQLIIGSIALSFGLGIRTVSAAPASITVTPTNGEKGVNPSSPLRLVFDRIVTPQTGDITLTAEGAANPDVTLSVGSSGLVGSSTQFEIRLPAPLASYTTYTVNVPAGLFKDTSGTDSLAATWSFTTQAEIDPRVTGSVFSPARGDRVASSSLSLISFELNAAVTGGGGIIRLMDASTNQAIRTFTISTNSSYLSTAGNITTVSLPLGTPALPEGRSYYVLIDEYAFKTADNRAFAGISGNNWSFSTMGSNTVSLTGTTPSDRATGISVGSPLQLQFDRPVYPGTGSITISPGGVNDNRARVVGVNSTAVTGGGSQRITIAGSTLLAGAVYTVTIPTGAFYDQDNRPFPASGTYSWTFTTAPAGSAPTASLYPTDGTNAFPVSGAMSLTFNRAVTYNPNVADGVVVYKSGGGRVSNVTVVPTSSTVYTIRPGAALDPDSMYYIDVKSGVFTDTANPMLSYAGISGASRWTFRTATVDRIAPVIESAAMEGNRTIRIKYNKMLKSDVSLLTSSFPVTVNAENRSVSGVSISGDSVYLTLSTGVAVGQVVRVSYTGGVRTIQDLSGNAASTFSQRTVTNGLDSSLPTPKEGVLSGRTLTLTFNDTIRSVSSYSYGQFSVVADGYSLGVNSISSGGSNVYLNLTGTAGNTSSVRVSYYPGSYPLQDSYGQSISAFSDFYVRNMSDTTPPVFQNATGNGKEIELTYNEGLNTTNLPVNSQFSVLNGNTAIYVTSVSVAGSKVKLELQSTLPANGNVTVSYIPGSNGISDLNGNRAASLNLQPVSITSTVSGVNSASVNGSELNLSFGQAMNTAYTPNASQFAVRSGQTALNVRSAQWSGNSLKLELSPAVSVGQTVDLSYMTSNGSLRDTAGNIIPSFSAMNVQNVTGTTGTSNPSYLNVIGSAEFGSPLTVLKSDSATVTNDRSVFNQAAKRYAISQDRLRTGYNHIFQQNQTLLGFEVPSTETSAFVTVPVAPLIEAVTKNDKASFVVRHGDRLLELKLKDVNFSALNNGSNGELQFQIESVPAGTHQSFEGLLSSRGLHPVAGLTDIRLLSSLGGSGTGTIMPEVKLRYSVRTTWSVNKEQAALNRAELNYADASYIPTSFATAGDYTIFSGPVYGQDLVGAYLSQRVFTDMSTHWARSAVNELTSKNIIDNSYGTSFRPGTATTRAEFAVMLSRGLGLTGSPETAQRFRDVQANTQTGAYIGAAAKAGIITGNTDGTFRPNDLVTREQMAIMMVRALEYTGNPVTLNGTPASVLASYKDRNLVQATEQVAKAITGGIVNGVSTGVFDPRGNATRAQAAIMLQRMLKQADYL